MPFTGETNITVFFGTNYDDINVPYHTAHIATHASKTLSLTSQVLWQTTFISAVRVNVEDYQDIVGAQYVRIDDVGTSNHGAHWFSVLGYMQLSKRTALLGLMYDALLSIGIDAITGISGAMKRWTVTNDSSYRYINSTEPINQIMPYNYSYHAFDNHYTETITQYAGFPYNMNSKPNVINYVNQDGTSTGVLFPDLKPAGISETLFQSSVGNGVYYKNGLRYYNWKENGEYKDNYNLTVGLGFDIVCDSYQLPESPIITIIEANNSVLLMQTTTQNYTSSLSLNTGTYNNRKSSELGNIFTLFSPVSGDSLTINNYDIKDSSGFARIRVSVNPGPGGCFYARLIGYYGNDLTGLVKSVSWSDAPITTRAGMGAIRSGYDNAIARDRVMLNSQLQINSLNTGIDNSRRSASFDVVANTANAVGNAVALNPAGVAGNLTGTIKTSVDLENATNTFNTSYNNIIESRTQQRQELLVSGTLGLIEPGKFKQTETLITEGSAFTFVVSKSSLSDFDRQRFDRFATAYGYNVNGELLTSKEQLHNRSRFTFIMADDVKITETIYTGRDMTRIHDKSTVQQIQDRFSSGIRIWNSNPDFDYTSPNPVV